MPVKKAPARAVRAPKQLPAALPARGRWEVKAAGAWMHIGDFHERFPHDHRQLDGAKMEWVTIAEYGERYPERGGPMRRAALLAMSLQLAADQLARPETTDVERADLVSRIDRVFALWARGKDPARRFRDVLRFAIEQAARRSDAWREDARHAWGLPDASRATLAIHHMNVRAGRDIGAKLEHERPLLEALIGAWTANGGTRNAAGSSKHRLFHQLAEKIGILGSVSIDSLKRELTTRRARTP